MRRGRCLEDSYIMQKDHNLPCMAKFHEEDTDIRHWRKHRNSRMFMKGKVLPERLWTRPETNLMDFGFLSLQSLKEIHQRREWIEQH